MLHNGGSFTCVRGSSKMEIFSVQSKENRNRLYSHAYQLMRIARAQFHVRGTFNFSGRMKRIEQVRLILEEFEHVTKCSGMSIF